MLLPAFKKRLLTKTKVASDAPGSYEPAAWAANVFQCAERPSKVSHPVVIFPEAEAWAKLKYRVRWYWMFSRVRAHWGKESRARFGCRPASCA